MGPPDRFCPPGGQGPRSRNTIEAFELALRLGATGLESDAWVTADGQVVLDHDGVVGSLLRGRRRKPIAAVDRCDLPAHIPTLDELYERCGTDFQLSLDVKDPLAVGAVIEVARAFDATDRLWLCHPDVEIMTPWRDLDDDVRLVNSTRLERLKDGPERRAATLSERGIDAVNMPYVDWTAGLVTLFHRFECYALGWDAQHDRMIADLLDMGIDGIFSDHVDRLMDGIRARAGS